jgi:hypothetical protein
MYNRENDYKKIAQEVFNRTNTKYIGLIIKNKRLKMCIIFYYLIILLYICQNLTNKN